MRLLGLGPDIGPGAGEGQDVVPACEEGLGAVWSLGQEPCTRVTGVEPYTRVTGQKFPELTKPHSNCCHKFTLDV